MHIKVILGFSQVFYEHLCNASWLLIQHTLKEHKLRFSYTLFPVEVQGALTRSEPRRAATRSAVLSLQPHCATNLGSSVAGVSCSIAK